LCDFLYLKTIQECIHAKCNCSPAALYPLCSKHCVRNKMGKHSSSNTELVTLLQHRTGDAVGTENTGRCCDTELVMGLIATRAIFGADYRCLRLVFERDCARHPSIPPVLLVML
jgi:hypothetical protein